MLLGGKRSSHDIRGQASMHHSQAWVPEFAEFFPALRQGRGRSIEIQFLGQLDGVQGFVPLSLLTERTQGHNLQEFPIVVLEY